MRRRARSILAAGALLLGGASLAPIAQAQTEVRTVHPTPTRSRSSAPRSPKKQIPLLLAAGQDGHELGEQAPGEGHRHGRGLPHRQAGRRSWRSRASTSPSTRSRPRRERAWTPPPTACSARTAAAAASRRRSSGPRRRTRPSPRSSPSARPSSGQDILALKLTKDAKKSKDGSKPSVLYMSNQHAREWITPEMTRRLMHHYLDNYKTDKRIKKIVDSTELWFVLSANPDGYDYTFQNSDNRLWRKNLRDVNGDGAITIGDGVDLNRNFAYKWGYDDEGSSPNPTSETYRGAAPASEPETKALDAFEKRIGFDVRHQLPLRRRTPPLRRRLAGRHDRPRTTSLYKALAGTPDNSAIPGYHPQVSSELYTTNGEADGHAANVNGMAMFTPEMSTCQTASNLDPDDQWNAADCQSVFNFPDDEKLIQQEFAKNVPFALSVAETAAAPRPAELLGRPDRRRLHPGDRFTTSYSRGADQEVSVVVRKSVRDKELKYRVNGGRTEDMALRPWKGGETYGGDGQPLLRRVPGQGRGRRPGRQGRGLVHRRDEERQEGLQRALHLHRRRAAAGRHARRRRGGRDRHAGADVRRRAEGQRPQGDRLGRRHPGRARRARRARPLQDGRPLHGRERPRQRHPAPAARLPQRGRQADRGGRAGRRQRRPRRRHPVERLQPVLPGRLLPYVHARRPPASPAPASSTGFSGALGDAPGNPLDAAGHLQRHLGRAARRHATRSSRARARASSPGPSTRTGRTRAPPWQPPSHTDDAYKRLTRTVDLTGVTAAAAAHAAHPAAVGHRAGLRPRGPRGPHRRGRRLDHAPGGGRRHQHHRARRVRGRVLHPGAPLAQALPDPRPRRLHRRPAPAAPWNSLTGASSGLAAGQLRPERLRGQDGRGLDQLRHRPRHRRPRRPRRRRLARRRRHGDARPRASRRRSAPGASPDRPRAARPSSRTGRAPGELFKTYGAVTTGRHRAAGLRPGARHRGGRPQGAHRKGTRCTRRTDQPWSTVTARRVRIE